MKIRILFVEDDLRLQNVLLEAAAINNFLAEGVNSSEAAIELMQRSSYDILVTDVTLPGMSGLDLLQHCQRLNPGIIPVVMTAYGTIDVAVEAMKRGATDFIAKPFQLDTLLSTIRVAAERVSRRTVAPKNNEPKSDGIVAESTVMQKLLAQVTAIAPFNTTVLITGETGTGKELIARSTHYLSTRQARPLVAMNCAAIPEQLLEDELFGHTKGAFTGAQTAREGRFEQADGGSLFLDEIGDMSLPLQSKLLRVLQERQFERLGSARTMKVDVRIIAATSADLERRVADGSFRSDLFYRLNVVHLRVPALRDRVEDIRPLAEVLIARFCEGAGLPVKTIGSDVWETLLNYRWPGNVRQLQNAMERAAALTGSAGEIHLSDLPEEVREAACGGMLPNMHRVPRLIEAPIPDQGLNFEAIVSQVERELLLRSLSQAGGNKMRAAKLLNMKRTTFVEKLKRLKIETESQE
ncbi:MAG: sigma-54 dependent transcriptional regulator [Pyrinomonadaceae bacterium]